MNQAPRSLLLGFSLIAALELHAQRTPGQPYLPLPAPVVTIGAEGDPDYEFVSIGTALRLPSGEIAVSDRRSPTIRIFSDKGRLVRTLGRDGEGPGEFRRVTELIAARDTLVAYDNRLRRLTRYLASGPLVGTQPVHTPEEEGPVRFTGRLAGGRWLVTASATPGWEHGHGVHRDSVRAGSLPPSGSGQVRWVGMFPGTFWLVHMPGEDKRRWAVGPIPVSPIAVVGTTGDTIVVGNTGTPELQFFHPDGRLVRWIALPLDGPVDPSEQRAAARREGLAGAREERDKAYVAALYEAQRPTPRYQSFTVAADGELWIRHFEEKPADPSRYLVLSPLGVVRARYSLPARSRVLTVQGPWVLVALRDEDDVERVALIRRPVP